MTSPTTTMILQRDLCGHTCVDTTLCGHACESVYRITALWKRAEWEREGFYQQQIHFTQNLARFYNCLQVLW